ncbi:DinB family protein [Allorhizocola rhizosphaerae]|uniref:DinB family protein n=1 Tax=Allorhizocola rhizosphaerae TaxID=1872709 RepID=UPI000E3BB52C|nr:DinB family protein [Allorhizocola rhizosphaerae]
MDWIAPEVTRAPARYVGDERAVYQSMLEFHRETLLMKCTGLTAEQLKLRSVEPSTLTLLGLVRHMTEVERSWFRRRASGLSLDWIYCTEASPEGDFDDVAGADPQADFDALIAETKQAEADVAGFPLDHTIPHPSRGPVSLRWIYLHILEEYARHNGHADLLRERIDGVTGE